jgi:deazaflavin-dependent oxidoreductase (nitroreductase family)
MSAVARLARRLGSYRWFAVAGRAGVPLDRLLGRLSRGRFVALGQRDLPSLLITTTGRRSGRPRTNPLLYTPDGDDFVVVATNWGQPRHPDWSNNLLAQPRAVVILGGREIPVEADLVPAGERDRLWAALRTIWPGYDGYRARAGREIRMFRLRPVPHPDR